ANRRGERGKGREIGKSVEESRRRVEPASGLRTAGVVQQWQCGFSDEGYRKPDAARLPHDGIGRWIEPGDRGDPRPGAAGERAAERGGSARLDRTRSKNVTVENAGAGPLRETTSEKIGLALQHHQAGRLAQAEALYREVLALDPQNIDALHFLGVIAHQQGRHKQAEELISRALLRDGSNIPAYSNLGNALEAQGKLQEAIDCYQRALVLAPDYVDALVNLGA